jgi:hypothetical protein
VYVGDYDEYGLEDGSLFSPSQSLFEKFVVPNLGIG